ncbi:MAG: phosphatase PAP2 family protein [Patulibacter minatonensis]
MATGPTIDDLPPDADDLDPRIAAAEAQERADARRSLRARLTGGPLLRTVGRIDRAGMRWLRGQARSRRVTRAVRSYSHLGEHGAIWIAIGVGGALVDRRRRDDWVSGLASVGAAYLVNTSLKQVARRPRPSFEDLPPLIPTPGPLSFPSSHSASSAAAVVAYGGLLPRTPLAVAASTMAISRVHLGVHYPSDIAIGALLGTGIARGAKTLRAKVG